MGMDDYEKIKVSYDRAAGALAAAVVYGTSAEHLEKLKAEFRASDKAYCDAAGLDYAAMSRPYKA